MVWNEEVTQKDVGTIAQDAKAWQVRNQKRLTIPVATTRLVEGFNRYEDEYNRCFDSWVAGRLKMCDLAGKAAKVAAAVQPASTKEWSPDLIKALPMLLAHVFSYFTIVKSGESWKRLSDNQDKLSKKRDSSGEKVLKNVLMRPHATQVLTVLQMLGYGSADKALQCQLMQIRTGEGKSLILGACAVVLALLGFSVRCVCYSEYLSQRDHALFKELFDAFGISDLVTYSTITDYSEDAVKKKGDIRKLTAALLDSDPSKPQPMSIPRRHLASRLNEAGEGSGGDQSSSGRTKGSWKRALVVDGSSGNGESWRGKAAGNRKRAAEGERSSDAVSKAARGAASGWTRVSGCQGQKREAAGEILLIDEVDVFFGKDFYGKTHFQSVELDCSEAEDLLRAVWRLYTSLLARANGQPPGYSRLLKEVKQTQEYSAMKQRFPQWSEVVDREVEAMCADALTFDNPEPYYDRAMDKLGYKIMDGINFEVVYRYKTPFACVTLSLYITQSHLIRIPLTCFLVILCNSCWLVCSHLHFVDNNRFRDPDAALKRCLKLQIPCGKFSYANIKPECILGVSGTLEALGDYELQVTTPGIPQTTASHLCNRLGYLCQLIFANCSGDGTL